MVQAEISKTILSSLESEVPEATASWGNNFYLVQEISKSYKERANLCHPQYSLYSYLRILRGTVSRALPFLKGHLPKISSLLVWQSVSISQQGATEAPSDVSPWGSWGKEWYTSVGQLRYSVTYYFCAQQKSERQSVDYRPGMWFSHPFSWLQH